MNEKNKIIKKYFSDFITKIRLKSLIKLFVILAVFSIASPVSAATYTDDEGTVWDYTPISQGIVQIAGYLNVDGRTSITIPKKIGTSTVNGIKGSAFKTSSSPGSGSLVSVTIPGSVKSIGSSAFDGCTNLTTVTFTDDGLETIDKSAFYGCKKLSSITIPNTVTKIDSYAFGNCNSLGDFVIPDSVTEFGTYVFRMDGSSDTSSFPGLTSVVLGKNVAPTSQSPNIPTLSGTFIYCNKLESITINNVNTSAGFNAFYGCASLDKIVIPCTYDKNQLNSDNSIEINGDNFTVTVDRTTTKSGTFDYSHTYGNPTYSWADDNSTCTGSLTCTNPGGTTENPNRKFEPGHAGGADQMETVDTIKEQTKAPTCTETGIDTYTANFTKSAFSQQTKGVDTAIDPSAHNWEQPSYSWEKEDSIWKCKGQRLCANNEQHIDGETVYSLGEQTKAPTCTEMGETTYTATFTKPEFLTQTKVVEDIDIDPNAHSWEDTWANDLNNHWHECSRCRKTNDLGNHYWEIDSIENNEKNYVCKICGKTKKEIIPDSDSNSPTDDSDKTNNESHKGSEIYSPQTGDFTNLYTILTFATLSYFGIPTLKRRPKNAKQKQM